ncbi:hypothetical protein V8C42DRAFT_311189 [Trichoderma barbatum]
MYSALCGQITSIISSSTTLYNTQPKRSSERQSCRLIPLHTSEAVVGHAKFVKTASKPHDPSKRYTLRTYHLCFSNENTRSTQQHELLLSRFLTTLNLFHAKASYTCPTRSYTFYGIPCNVAFLPSRLLSPTCSASATLDNPLWQHADLESCTSGNSEIHIPNQDPMAFGKRPFCRFLLWIPFKACELAAWPALRFWGKPLVAACHPLRVFHQSGSGWVQDCGVLQCRMNAHHI